MRKLFKNETNIANGASDAEYFRLEKRGMRGRLRTLQGMAGGRSPEFTFLPDSDKLRVFQEREDREERNLRERHEREYSGVGDWEEREAAFERRKLDLAQFRAVLRAGSFASVHLVAEGPAFHIEMAKLPMVTAGKSTNKTAKVEEDREKRLILVTTKERQTVRFRNPRQPLTLLYGMGVTEVRIELMSWRPEMRGDWSRRRPDLAELLLFAHEHGKVVTEPDTTV